MSKQRAGSYVDSRYHVEGWRANVPLFRAIATSASILLSVAFFTWQGSQWMARIENRLVAIEQATTDKASLKDVDHKFELMCAKAPPSAKQWVCK